MAHLALLHDADPARRDRFAAATRSLFAELPGTRTDVATAGPVTCLWATAPAAPVDLHSDGARLALLIGYAVTDAGTWATARELADTWLAEGGEATAHDGYHVGVAYEPTRGLAAGVDPLGLFPLYHTSLPAGGFMLATTPLAFFGHPLFPRTIDREGLAGILLAHGILADRPLLAGARRLQTAHRLRAQPGHDLEERRIFQFPATDAPAGERFTETRDRIGDLLLATLRRHRPPGDDTLLMLSGGLDSRLIAGCLADLGMPPRAVTFGRLKDYEVRAASAVAGRLGLPIERIATETSPAGFVARARQAARFSQLWSGPGGDDFADALQDAATRARFTWSGIPLDWVFEPISKHNGYDAARDTWSLEGLVSMVNGWGVPVERLPALLGPDGRSLVAAVLDRLREQCTAGPLPPARQSALVRWDQRVRNHLAAALHRTSFVAWPLMPATDRRFFSAIFELPVPIFADRGLEKAILTARRPDLAAIPLDTNSFSFEPLLPPGGRPRRLAAVARSVAGRLRRATQRFLPLVDPRRYERVFDVDQPRWRAVRRAAEPLRPLLHEHLDPTTLVGVLPPADRRLHTRKPLQAGSPIRLLCGLAFALDR